jgi:hypothetical protein
MSPIGNQKFTRFAPFVLMGMVALVGGTFLTVLSVQQNTENRSRASGSSFTIGTTSVGTMTDTGNNNSLHCFKYTASGTGVLSSISIFIANTNSYDKTYSMGIYKDSYGSPSTLLARTGDGQLTANSWNSLPISAAVSAGSYYWLCYNSRAGNDSYNNIKYSSGSTPAVYRSQSYGSWPSSFGSVQARWTDNYSIYASASVAGAPTPTSTYGYPPTPTPTTKPCSTTTYGSYGSSYTTCPTPTPTKYYLPTPTPTVYHAPTPTPTIYKAPTPTPTVYQSPTPTPTVYNMPTPTPTVYNIPTPTQPFEYPTPTPTHAPYPTSTPMPYVTVEPGSSSINFTLALHGLGNGGDSANPNGQGNATPLHPQRTVAVDVYDASNSLVTSQNGLVTFNSTSGYFEGLISLGSSIASGPYTVKVKTDQFLRTIVPGIQNLVANQSVNLPKTALIGGDINSDNQLNILDYNILMGCYSDLSPAISCAAGDEVKADITDDGAVNQFDYNLFLRELINRGGQ